MAEPFAVAVEVFQIPGDALERFEDVVVGLERVGRDLVVVDNFVLNACARVVVCGRPGAVNGERSFSRVFLLREVRFAVCEGSEMWGWFTVRARQLARAFARVGIVLFVLPFFLERRYGNLPLGNTLLVI